GVSHGFSQVEGVGWAGTRNGGQRILLFFIDDVHVAGSGEQVGDQLGLLFANTGRWADANDSGTDHQWGVRHGTDHRLVCWQVSLHAAQGDCCCHGDNNLAGIQRRGNLFTHLGDAHWLHAQEDDVRAGGSLLISFRVLLVDQDVDAQFAQLRGAVIAAYGSGNELWIMARCDDATQDGAIHGTGAEEGQGQILCCFTHMAIVSLTPGHYRLLSACGRILGFFPTILLFVLRCGPCGWRPRPRPFPTSWYHANIPVFPPPVACLTLAPSAHPCRYPAHRTGARGQGAGQGLQQLGANPYWQWLHGRNPKSHADNFAVPGPSAEGTSSLRGRG